MKKSLETLLQAEMKESKTLIRPEDDHYFDFLADRFSLLRRFSPRFLEAVTFFSNTVQQPVLLQELEITLCCSF